VAIAGGPKLLWWAIPADSLLHNARSGADGHADRVETAINAIG
jgi:hypothetical protein